MTDTDEERDRAAWEERVARVMIAPGSWHARDLQVVDEHGELVLTAIARPGQYAHQIASTRLAASAPDLSAALLACRDRLAAIERDTDERTEIAVADAALAKARGGA